MVLFSPLSFAEEVKKAKNKQNYSKFVICTGRRLFRGRRHGILSDRKYSHRGNEVIVSSLLKMDGYHEEIYCSAHAAYASSIG